MSYLWSILIYIAYEDGLRLVLSMVHSDIQRIKDGLRLAAEDKRQFSQAHRIAGH